MSLLGATNLLEFQQQFERGELTEREFWRRVLDLAAERILALGEEPEGAING
jgi:hypothetical protein